MIRKSGSRFSEKIMLHPRSQSANRFNLEESHSMNISADREPAGFPEISFSRHARRYADPLDFPFQLDTGMRFDPLPHRFAERLDVGGGRGAEIDQKIAVHLRYLRVADAQTAATRGIDQLPRFSARRIFEGGTAGTALDRLRRLARLGDLSISAAIAATSPGRPWNSAWVKMSHQARRNADN